MHWLERKQSNASNTIGLRPRRLLKTPNEYCCCCHHRATPPRCFFSIHNGTAESRTPWVLASIVVPSCFARIAQFLQNSRSATRKRVDRPTPATPPHGWRSGRATKIQTIDANDWGENRQTQSMCTGRRRWCGARPLALARWPSFSPPPPGGDGQRTPP